MKMVNQQAPAIREETASVQTFLNDLLAVLQTLQVRLQKVLPAEKNTEPLPLMQRLQVADVHWVASLVEMHDRVAGRVLVLEARHRHPDWSRLMQLRQESLLADLPLLVILQEDNPQTIAEAYQMGADACLVQPVSPAQLLGITLYLLQRGRRQAA